MFLALLGGSLVSGACLLAAASFSDGALVASQTAAQLIGWLLVLSPLLAFARLRRSLAELGVASIALSTGTAVLYVSYFEWSAANPQGPMAAHAANIVPGPAIVEVPAPVAPMVAPALPALAVKRAIVPALVPVEVPMPAQTPATEYRNTVIPESPPY